MKQAKASDQEVETLAQWLQDLENNPALPSPPNWMRVVFGYQLLKNNCCDPAKDYLDWKPGESPEDINVLKAELHEATKQLKEIQTAYNELIYAVGSKFDNETRHQTALRYINQTEANCVKGPAEQKL